MRHGAVTLTTGIPEKMTMMSSLMRCTRYAPAVLLHYPYLQPFAHSLQGRCRHEASSINRRPARLPSDNHSHVAAIVKL